jgi:shikimate dehydrogenase
VAGGARGELKGREPNVIDGRIDGETLLFATPGDPIAQVRLPLVMGPVFAALGINAVWVPMHADRKGLHIVLEAIRTIRNFRGITVAIPHKMAVLDMVEDVSDVARAAGAVNLVRREPDGTLFGDMADGAGFVRGLELQGHSVQGASVWLIGAGGGGAAIAAALAEAGVARIAITETDRARGARVIERLGRFYPHLAVELTANCEGAVDFAINATPCGLQPDDPLPFDPRPLGDSTVVCDIIMKPRETALLLAARGRGLAVHHGQHMLDAQIPMYLRFFGFPVVDEAAVIAMASGVPA